MILGQTLSGFQLSTQFSFIPLWLNISPMVVLGVSESLSLGAIHQDLTWLAIAIDSTHEYLGRL